MSELRRRKARRNKVKDKEEKPNKKKATKTKSKAKPKAKTPTESVNDSAAKDIFEEVEAEVVEDNRPHSFWIQLNFFGATIEPDGKDLEDIYDAVITEAENRGFYFDKGFAQPIQQHDIPMSSRIHEQITGSTKGVK